MYVKKQKKKNYVKNLGFDIENKLKPIILKIQSILNYLLVFIHLKLTEPTSSCPKFTEGT